MANRRDEHDRYRGDVWYEEWRSGLPEGAISDDSIDDGFYDGLSPESLVGDSIRRMSGHEQQLCEQQWPEEQPPEEQPEEHSDG